LDDVPLGSLARACRLDLSESESAFHRDNLVSVRLIATGERLGHFEKAMTSVRLSEIGAFVRSRLPATPTRTDRGSRGLIAKLSPAACAAGHRRAKGTAANMGTEIRSANHVP
jgi:hypothetical protein